MRSDDRSPTLDLTRDLPTTESDVAALRRAASTPRLNLEAYLRFLAQFPKPADGSLRSKPGPRGPRPFDLIG
jgi:hypothetical protein